MQVKITTRKSDVPERFKDYARQKVQRLKKYYDMLQEINIIVDSDGPDYHVELLANAGHNNTFVSHEANEDLRACVDIACDKLEMQLRRHKERYRNRKHPT